MSRCSLADIVLLDRRTQEGLEMGETTRRIARRIIAEDLATADGLVAAIEGAISSLFPESFIKVRFTTGLSPVIHIVFAFTKEDGWPSHIIENDRAFHRIFVGNGEIGSDGALPPKLKVEVLTGGTVYGPNVTNGVKVGWRNRTGTPQQVVRHIATYFGRLATVLQEHPDAGKWAERPA